MIYLAVFYVRGKYLVKECPTEEEARWQIQQWIGVAHNEAYEWVIYFSIPKNKGGS